MVKRAAPDSQTDTKESSKKARHEKTHQSDQLKFSSAEDIREALRSPDIDTLTQVLRALRNQFTVRSDENPPAPQDERLLLVKSWLEKSPGAQDIFSIMGWSPKPTFHVLSLCLAILASLLNLLSSQFIYHAFGHSIIKTLLSPSHMRQLNANLNESSSELIKSTLKVLNAMSTFSGGSDKRSVMDEFAWNQKSLQKLLFLRQRGKRNAHPSTDRLDIRTLYIYFILSFLSNTTPTSIKLSLLEQHRDVFLLIFKGIHQDAYIVVRNILEVCWDGIWNDPKIKRTLKVGLFNETTLNHLLKLYDRAIPEDDNEDRIPADIIHHFMLAILTRPGTGICFKDRGWYPRDTAVEETSSKEIDLFAGDEPEKRQGGKIHNRILANIVKGLKVNEDPRQQELAFKILEACPELVLGYWGSANLTLEPRLSSRWITNISILSHIISFPIPIASFILPHSTYLNPTPPPLTSLLANVLPAVLNKTYLTKGLQSPSSLVQHCTALALSKCLSKLDCVLQTFRETAFKLEEVDETGQWLQRTQELQAEVEKRVPGFMVIVGMVQQKYDLPAAGQSNTKAPLLTESALRLLRLYHKLLPRLVAEVKFEVGKLLLTVCDSTNGVTENENNEEPVPIKESPNGLDTLQQLHVLHVLNESEQFSWISRFGTSSHSYLHAIFMLYAKTQHEAVRQTTSELLTHILSSSIMFSHDTAELDLWLAALPMIQRASTATAPDGTRLADEKIAVLTFLDDCIQRCFKTPYRYLEEARAFFNENTANSNGGSVPFSTRDDSAALPSPLLMTVLEQLRAKITANLLSPSDILAIVTFLRKFTCSLVGKIRNLRILRKIHTKLTEILSASPVAPNSLVLRNAIERESNLLSNILDFVQNPINQTPTSTNNSVQEFLKQVEALSIPSSEITACNGAYELVDWMRLIDLPLHPTEVKRVFSIILRFHPPAATEFLYQLDPKLGQLWFAVGDHLEPLEKYLPYEWAHLHATTTDLTQQQVASSLLALFFSQRSWNTLPERRIAVSMYRLAPDSGEAITTTTLREAQLGLLSSIMARGQLHQTALDYKRLKQAIFVDSEPIRELLCSQDVSSLELSTLSNLVKVALDPQDGFDSSLAYAYCKYWMSDFMTTTEIQSCKFASPWIPFMEPSGVMQYLDISISSVEGDHSLAEADQRTISAVLEVLVALSGNVRILGQLQARIRGLLAIRRCFQSHDTLDNLLLSIVERSLPVGFNVLASVFEDSGKLSKIIEDSQERWNVRSNFSHDGLMLISVFLQSETWNQTTVRIISGAIYASSEARNSFWTWVTNTEPPEAALLKLLIFPIHAYVDVMSTQSNVEVTQIPNSWFSAIVGCFLRRHNSDNTTASCASCIRLLFRPSSNRTSYIACLTKEIKKMHSNILSPDFIRLLRDLYQLEPEALSPVVNVIIEESLKWMAGVFSGSELSENEVSILDELSLLVSRADNKAYLVEPIIKTAIQNCLHMPCVMKCITTLVSSTRMKPLIINRQLQSVVQHPQLYRISDMSLPSREPVIGLLHTLFYSHPTNTCQPSHIAPIARLYGGTLSLSDQLLLSIFYLYEKQRKESVASIFRYWSPSSTLPSEDILQAIINLDPNRVFRTCTAFPTRRPLDGSVVRNLSNSEDIYDPAFLALLLVQLLSKHKVLSTSDWVQFFRSNIVSLVICVLTSRVDAFRIVGVKTLGGILRRVEEAEFLERDQVLYILNMLRDLLPPASTSQSYTRLPTYSTLLLAHALRATFYPSSFLYPVISRFLMQRPELDTTDVPMLYNLLYSCEDGEWSKERSWMIRFLTDAMRDGGRQDWTILKRRHTWDLIASMWQATRPDERSLRKGVLEFLANLSSNYHAATSLVLRSSFLPWIEMQLENKLAIDTEYVAWLKILENIIVIVDVNKAEKATRGEFASSFARCLYLIHHRIATSGSAVKMGLLQLASRVLLRLAIRSPRSDTLANAVREAMHVIRRVEALLSWTNVVEKRRSRLPEVMIPPPPHRAPGLFDVNKEECTVQVWAESAVNLWKVVMLPEHHDVAVWNMLTCRLIVLRVSPWFDYREEPSVEWARRESLIHVLQMERKGEAGLKF